MAEKPPCGKCYFFGWDGVRRACFHPEAPRMLELAPAKCGQKIDIDQKAHPKRWWPEKLTLEVFRVATQMKEDGA